MWAQRRSWYVDGYYAAGRIIGRTLRLRWYGSGAGRRVECKICQREDPRCRMCGGVGELWKTDGVI